MAQVPTRAGSNFRVELPPGRYEIEVIEPRGTHVFPATLVIHGGAVQRTTFVWPYDGQSRQGRRLDDSGAGNNDDIEQE